SWPGKIGGGQVSHDNVQSIDLLPTLVVAAGGSVDPGHHVEGMNLLPLWTGRARTLRRTLYWEWQSEGSDQVAATSGDEKLVVTRGGKPELYDLAADPSERRDVSALHPESVKELYVHLKDWMRSNDLRGNE